MQYHMNTQERGRLFGPTEFGAFRGGPRGMHGRGGGRGRRRMFDSNELRLVLLKLINDESRHGYDLIREIESLTGGAYAPSPGVVYPTLTMLADMELVVEQLGERSRKLFAITDTGKAHLIEHREEVLQAFSRLEALAKLGEQTNSAPLRRAVENLKMAIHGRLEKEGADADTMFDVVALLDDAARKIERL